MVKNNNNGNQQRQPFASWSHPAQWGRGHPTTTTEEEETNRYHPNEDGEHSQYHQHSSRGSPTIVPWSPWSPPGRNTLRSSSRLLEEQSSSSLHEPLLSTPTHSRSFDYDYHQEEEEAAEEEEENQRTNSSCCSRWRRSFCGCCSFCCFRKASQSRSPRRQQQQRQQSFPNGISEEEEDGNDASAGSSNGLCCKVMHLLLASIMFGILFHISGKGNHQQWTMTAQESRHVATAGFGLTDTVQVVSHTPAYDSHKDTHVNRTISRGMAVYAMGNPHCPPLTGPRVVVDSPSEELVLFQHAWEYQFFYLNTGSTMQVTLKQTQGATNVLVLRGSKVLARVQDTKRFSWRGEKEKQRPHMQYSDIALQFSAQQIMLERFSWTQEGSPIEFSFTSPASDVYVLLFDNAAKSEPAQLQVKYHMELTTYNLEGLLPWCSHTALPSMEETTFTCPPLQVSKAGCILVEAVVSDESPSGNSNSSSATDDTFFAMGQEVVQVTLLTTRKWIYIGVLSMLPSILMALYLRRRRKKKQRRQRRRYYRTLQQQQQQQQQQATMNLRSNSTVANTNSSRQLHVPPGAMFQFLPAHHQESDPEEEGEVSEQKAVESNGHKEKLEEHQEPAISDSSSGETTLVPAKNVMVLSKDRLQGKQEGGSSSVAE